MVGLAFLSKFIKKSSMALSISLLDARSSTSGRRCRDIAFGSLSGFPSTVSPSASIGQSSTTFSSLFASSSGYAKIMTVMKWANPRGVSAGIDGAFRELS
jgi:hypothetical protein